MKPSENSGVSIDANGLVTVTSAAKPGLYEIVAAPVDPDSGFYAATCELLVK